MDKHITKSTELNNYAQVNRLDNEKLWFKFGQLSEDQEQIRTATREFVKECASEIRTETDSRNSMLVAKILDKHNRLIEVLLSKSSFLKTLVDEITVELSKDGTTSKSQSAKLTAQIENALKEVLEKKTQKSEIEPVSLLIDETIVKQFSKHFRSHMNRVYKQTLSEDRKSIRGLSIGKNVTRISGIVRSISKTSGKLTEKNKSQQLSYKKLSLVSSIGSLTTNKHLKAAQIQKLSIYNDYVLQNVKKTLDRVGKSNALSLWHKLTTGTRKKLRNFKSSVLSGIKFLFSKKALLGGVGIIGSVFKTVLIKPFALVGKLLSASLKGFVKFGLGMVKTAFGLTGKILNFVNSNMLSKIFRFMFTPAGMFIAGYLFAFFKDRFGAIFGGIKDKLTKLFGWAKDVFGSIKSKIASGLLTVVDFIYGNQVIQAFITKDHAEIAKFMVNIKEQFALKFDKIRDFFQEVTANVAANIAAEGLSWIGAAIGTCLGGPIGSIIGSLAGAGLAILLGKMFAKKIYDLPESDGAATKRLFPLCQKFGTKQQGDTFKEAGFSAQIQSQINQLKSKKEKIISNSKNGSVPDVSEIDTQIAQLENAKTMMSQNGMDQDNEKFYDKAQELVELTQNETENPFLYALPNSGDELKALLYNENMEAAAKNIGHKVGNKNIENDKNYADLYRSIKYKILDGLTALGRRYNLAPEKFCELYDTRLKKALGDHCTGLMKLAYLGSTKYHFQGDNITLGEMLTRPFITKDGNGVLKEVAKYEVLARDGGTYVSHDDEFGNIKKLMLNQQSAENADILKHINDIIDSDQKKGLFDELKTSLCGNDENKKKIFDQLPVETMYRKYLITHLFEGNEQNWGLSTFISNLIKRKTDLTDGFKEYLSAFLNLPQIDQMMKDKSGNSETVEKLWKSLGQLRITLKGVVDKTDESVKQAFANMSKNEETLQKEVEDDPELRKLIEDLEQKKRELCELEKEESGLQNDLVEEAKTAKCFISVLEKESKPKQDVSDEESKEEPWKSNPGKFGFPSFMGSSVYENFY